MAGRPNERACYRITTRRARYVGDRTQPSPLCRSVATISRSGQMADLPNRGAAKAMSPLHVNDEWHAGAVGQAPGIARETGTLGAAGRWERTPEGALDLDAERGGHAVAVVLRCLPKQTPEGREGRPSPSRHQQQATSSSEEFNAAPRARVSAKGTKAAPAVRICPHLCAQCTSQQHPPPCSKGSLGRAPPPPPPESTG
jgi:hypothetical protein